MKSLGILAISAATLALGPGSVYGQNWPGPNDDSRYQHTWRGSRAYEAGVRDGRADAQRNRRADPRSNQFENYEDQRDYEVGYHRGYDDAMARSQDNRGDVRNSTAFEEGMRAGQWDAQHNRQPRPRDDKWSNQRDRSDFEAGYNRGYQDAVAGYGQGMEPYGQYGTPGYGESRVKINRDNTVSWQAPGLNRARVFLQVDNQPVKLFAEGKSGRQEAAWMKHGHVYTFILRDIDGTELARDQVDLR
ncbi:MAG: hypothetical protein HYX72_00485 [Acidobacteria bacterium]|nr:hypothetical protein [Acidobacteriota bacterium]